MSENFDIGQAAPGPRASAWRAAALFAIVAAATGFIASRTQTQPYDTEYFQLFFSDPLHMKAWLTSIALLLAITQILTAARVYELLSFPPAGSFYAVLHRWSGRAAFLLTLPAAYHCIFKLGFGVVHPRVFIHSLLGSALYGALAAKIFLVRSSSQPGWALPAAGGALFAILMGIWITSAAWFFSRFGLGW